MKISKEKLKKIISEAGGWRQPPASGDMYNNEQQVRIILKHVQLAADAIQELQFTDKRTDEAYELLFEAEQALAAFLENRE